MNQACAGNDFAEAESIIDGTELLNGQFLIKSRLRSGGFGITYVARDSLDRQVVIKECFPGELCKRVGVTVQPVSSKLSMQFNAIKNQFIREARQMAQLVHPNIVAVHQVFEENNTAYMALDQIDGIDLVTLVESEPERITNSLLRSVMRQSLKAINFIHGKGLLHRDIAPDNIMVDSKGHLTLIDFGAAREYNSENKSTVIAVKDGYSPYEFYQPDGTHGFHSDLYSLAATLYYLAVGAPPPSSEERMEAIKAGEPDPYVPLATRKNDLITRKDKQIFATVDRALSMDNDERYDSVAAWAKDLVAQQQMASPNKLMTVGSPILESEIAQIVEMTNAQLGSSGSKKEKIAPVEDQSEKRHSKKLAVDMFGNPVEDIMTWHEKQEAEIRAREAARCAKPQSDEDEAQELRDGSETRAEIEPVRRRNPLIALVGRYLNVHHDPISK